MSYGVSKHQGQAQAGCVGLVMHLVYLQIMKFEVEIFEGYCSRLNLNRHVHKRDGRLVNGGMVHDGSWHLMGSQLSREWRRL